MNYSKSLLSLLSSLAIVCTIDQTISSENSHGKFNKLQNGKITVVGSIMGNDANDLITLLKRLTNSADKHEKEAAEAAIKDYDMTKGTALAKTKSAFQTYNTQLEIFKKAEEAHKEGQSSGLEKHEQKFLKVARKVTDSPNKEESIRSMSRLTQSLKAKGLSDFFEKEEAPKEQANTDVKKLEESYQNLESKLSESRKSSDKIRFLTTQYNLYRKEAGMPEVQHNEATIEVTQEEVKQIIAKLTEKLYLMSLMSSGGGETKGIGEKNIQKKVPLAQKIDVFTKTYTTMGKDERGEAQRNALIKEIFNDIIAAPEENANNTNAILKFLFENQNNGMNIGERQAQYAKWYFETAELHPRLKPLVKEFVTKYFEYLEAKAIEPAGKHWNIIRAKYGATNHFAKYTVNPENLKDHSYIKGSQAVPLIHLLAKNPMQLMDAMSMKNAKIYTELLQHTPYEVIDALYYLFWKLGVKEREGKAGPENIARSAFIRKLKEIHEEGEDHWRVIPLPNNYDPYVAFFGENKDGDYTRYWEDRKNDIGEIMSPPGFNMEGEYIPGSEENVTRSMDRDTFELEEKTMGKTVTSMDREPKHSVISESEKLAILQKEKLERAREAEAKKQIKIKIMAYLKTHVGNGIDVEVKGFARTGALKKLISDLERSSGDVTDEVVSNYMHKQDLTIFHGKETDLLKGTEVKPEKTSQELEAERIEAEKEARRLKELELTNKIQGAITKKHSDIKRFIGAGKPEIVKRLKDELLNSHHNIESINEQAIENAVNTLTQDELVKLRFAPTLQRKPQNK